MKRVWSYLCGAGISLAAVFFAASGYGQELPPVPDVPAVEPAKDAVEPVKDAVEPVKDAVKGAADTAKDAVEPVRDAARDAAGVARDATRDAAGAARDAARGVREGARDAARGAREGVRDVREGARDTVRDVREGVRDIRGSVNASGSARANLQWQDLQSADVGLWFNRDTRDGLVIADVATQGPIAKLGFQEGDRIVSVAGQPITRQADFMRFVFSSKIRDGRVPVIVLRGGQETTIFMEPQVFLTHVNSYQSDPLENFGIILDDRVADRIVVWRVIPRSPAFFAGIRSGDVILTFNKQQIDSSAKLGELAAAAKAGPIAVEVQRGDRARILEVDFQANASVEARSALRPDYDSAAPMLDQPVRAASGYYDRGYTSGRRGLFRWRR